MNVNFSMDEKQEFHHEDFKCNVKRLTKVYDKDSKTYTFKSSEANIKKILDSLKIYHMKRNKEIILLNLCVKHVFVNRATDISIPRIDSCRIIGDPITRSILLSFPNPGVANNFEMIITKEKELYYSIYANISFFISATNKCYENLKKSASVCVSGLTTGKELKGWIENEFSITDEDIPNYEIHLKVNSDIQPISDDIPLLILYEHLAIEGTNDCSQYCFSRSGAPRSHISIDFRPIFSDVRKKETIFYSIEEKWVANMIPNWLMRILSDLYFLGPEHVGVFRLCGRESCLNKWYQFILDYEDFSVTEDIYNKAALLKFFIRNIKGSLMTNNLRKDFNHLCKKFVEVSAEKFLENEKKTKKLIKLIKSLPNPQFFLLQNLLVIIQALIKSEKTLLTPLSIARTISPSVFPLMSLSNWKNAAKLFEAIVLLTDKLVSDSMRDNIINNFTKFKQNSENLSTINPTVSDEISNESGSISVISNSETTSKFDNLLSEELCENDFEVSSALGHLTDDECISLSESEDNILTKQEDLICSIEERSPCVQNSTDKSTKNNENDENCCVSESSSESFSRNVNNRSSKNSICMGIKMKAIYRHCSKVDDSDLQTYPDIIIENDKNTKKDKGNLGLRHKSLIKSESSTSKDLNRSQSSIVTSPRIRNKNHHDSIKLSSINQVSRKNSRRALSEVVELNNSNSEVSHRSRSPNVKSLIKMYEEKNKLLLIDETVNIEHQKQSRVKKIPENLNLK